MQPPRAGVIPDVMVRVAADAEGYLFVFLGACGNWHTRNPSNKKPPIPVRKRR
jgi:hypothetical protein